MQNDDPLPSVSLPSFPYFCNVVVFPSTDISPDDTSFFILKNTADVPDKITGKMCVKYIPGSVYCLLPSDERCQGTVALYKTRPSFIDEYSYCLEINKQSIDFPSFTTDEPEKMSETDGHVKRSERCVRCFVSHFPSPNTLNCKWNRNKKKHVQPPRSHWPIRLRGGARTKHHQPILERAISLAKAHDINVHPGVENLANGNCAFETIIDSINTNSVFKESFDGTPDFWRNIWMTEVEGVAYENWNNGLTREQWMAGWSVLKKSGTYEYQLGDLVLPGIAHCVKKDIVIFNASHLAHSPVYVVEASMLAGLPANNEVPICLAYDQTHYETLVPDGEEDMLKIVALKRSVIEGNYHRRMEDFPLLRQDQSRSYAAAVKRSNEESPLQNKNIFRKTEEMWQTNIPKSPNASHTKDKVQSKVSRSKPKCGNRFSCLYVENTEDKLRQLDELKKIRSKDRTKDQKCKYVELMKFNKNENEKKRKASNRAAQSEEERIAQNTNNSKRKAAMRNAQSVEEKTAKKAKDCERKAETKKAQSEEEKTAQNAKDCKRMADLRKDQSA